MDGEEKSGILFIDKPVGMTSRQVDNHIGRLFHTHHIGHLGTLDPFASGMLVVFVNKANKAIPYVKDEEKTYVALLRLGKRSSTGDKDGTIEEMGTRTSFEKKEIENVFSSFRGDQEQVPPMTSAIKIDGEALYKKAHRGEEIERKPRKIHIFSLDLLFINEDTICFKTKVSKGTYIRTLGEDIAKVLGTYGYLEELRRIEIGDFKEDRLIPLDEVKEDSQLVNPLETIDLKRVYIDENCCNDAKNGKRLSFHVNEDKILLVYENEAIAVYERERGNTYRSVRGLF